MHLDLGLSKIGYDKLKLYSEAYNHNLLPCYNTMSKAGDKILPKSVKEKLTLTDRKIIFPTKNLAILTLKEYLDLPEVFKELNFIIKSNPGRDIRTTLLFDTGLDSATGQSDYHQLDSEGNPIDYSSLLTSQFMPLQLLLEIKGKRGQTLSKSSLYINELRHSPYSTRAAFINHVDMAGGGGVYQMSILLHKPY